MTEAKRNWVRRLYDWVLHWAETPYGPLALGILAFAEASFFPVPPDPLLMALCLGAASRSLRFAAITTAASVAGGILGYLLGALAWQVLGDFFFAYVPGVTPEAFDGIREFFETSTVPDLRYIQATPMRRNTGIKLCVLCAFAREKT